MTDYLSFYARALVKALALPRFDAVVTLTTPPIIGLVGTILRRWKGTRHVYWSMDLHPDASLALGRMSRRNPVVAGAGLAQRHGLPPRRQGRRARPLHGRPDRRQGGPRRPDRHDPGLEPARRDLPDPRAGHPLREALGLARQRSSPCTRATSAWPTRFDEIIAAARQLRDCSDIVFLFVGDGPRLAEVRAAQQAENLTNIRFLDYLPPRPVAPLAHARPTST